MTALIFTVLAVALVAGLLLYALTHHRQENPMPDTPPTSDCCGATWEFDVDFWVICSREPDHYGMHTALSVGNDDVEAVIVWGAAR